MASQREDLTWAEVAEHFCMPISDAAIRLGVANTTLKRICRENGLSRWPYRKFQAGRTIEEIKREAAENFARRGPDVGDDFEGDIATPSNLDVAQFASPPGTVAAVAPTPDRVAPPVSGAPLRESGSLIVRLPGPGAKAGGTPAVSGTKRSVPEGQAGRAGPTPIFQSILAQAPAPKPPSFPFPYPIPLSKRAASENRWKTASYLSAKASLSCASRLSDLWGPAQASASAEPAGVQGRTSRLHPPVSSLEHKQLDGTHEENSEGTEDGRRRSDAAEKADDGADAFALDCIAQVRRIREQQLARFSRGMSCSLSRGFGLELAPGDRECLDFVFHGKVE